MIDDEIKGTAASCLLVALHKLFYSEAKDVWQDAESHKHSMDKNMETLQYLGSLCFIAAREIMVKADAIARAKEEFILDRNEI